MRKGVLLIAIFLILLTITAKTYSQQGGYSIRSEVIKSGGNSATGGSFQLQGTIGQTNVDVMKGNDFQLTSGFWHPRSEFDPPSNSNDTIYLPFVIR